MSPSVQAAYEHNGREVQSGHFYAIACDPRRSVAVEACAGAGKTWMLVSRILRALLEGCAPHEVLAITFTKKAAGEMRQRLQEWLHEFAHASDATLCAELQLRGVQAQVSAEQLATLRGLHNTLLRGGRGVQIRTFHGWFAALVRTAPLGVLDSLGLPTQYELLESDTQAVALVWRRFQTRVAQDPQARADYQALVVEHGRSGAHKALESALSKRVEFALADRAGVVDASVQHFHAVFPDFAAFDVPLQRLHSTAALALLWAAARALGASTIATCSKGGSALEQALTHGDMAAARTALLTTADAPRKFSDKLAGLDDVRAAQALVMQCLDAENQRAAWLHQQRMARLTRGLVDDYAALKRERGWIDMNDLERVALALMADPQLSGWVQERLDARVRHLLIDEFQDTSPLQWQVLHAWLSGYGGAGQAPSVFIVGDPKQSIYRFRRAEPQVFRAAKAFVQQGLGGDVLSCDHTRRNAPEVIGLVNAVMLQAQGEGALDGYRTHTTASTAAGTLVVLPRLERAAKGKSERGEADSDDADTETELPWRDSLTTPRVEAEENRKALECRQAAQWLAQQLQTQTHSDGSPLQAKDILVLARKRERLGLMQAELSALGIAAQQPEKSELGEQPAVQDIVALVDALVSPLHNLALAQALKSPLFGMDDAALVHLALRVRQRKAQGEPSVGWLQLLQTDISLPQDLQHAGVTLTRWQHWLATLPPHDALSAIYEDGDVLARFAAAAPATQRTAVLAHVRAVLQAALGVDGGRYTTAYALVRAMRAGGIPAPVLADADAVRLLTVHGAKGLEAPVVVLLDTDGEAQSAQAHSVLVDWPGESAHPQRLVFLVSEARPPACVVPALQAEQQARRRDELNGLYVALTRSRSTLAVSSMAPHRQNEYSWWQRLQAFLPQAVAVPLGEPVTSAPLLSAAQQTCFPLKILPNKPVAAVEYAQAAIKNVATVAPLEIESADSRIGQAMHRLLEWVQDATDHPWSDASLAQVGREFTLDAEQLGRANQMALAILRGEGAWAWDAQCIRWAGNELTLNHQGRVLRIDRLVQHAHTLDWWVLDYKSASRPQDQPALLAQLAHYRAAVAQATPGQTIRAGFLTAIGTLIELTSP